MRKALTGVMTVALVALLTAVSAPLRASPEGQ